jgi:hypothetical protein
LTDSNFNGTVKEVTDVESPRKAAKLEKKTVSAKPLQ